MATSFQSFIDRENIINPPKGVQGQRSFTAKTFKENKYRQATPRKALGDLGNIQHGHGTGKKIQSSFKPSKIKIFEDVSKTNPRKSKIKTRKISHDTSENNLPEIEKMTPFIDQENNIPTPQCIKKLLQHPKLFKQSLIVPPSMYTNNGKEMNMLPSVYELETRNRPDFDDTMATIIGYDDKPELTLLDDSLPCLDDIPLDIPLFP